MRILSFISIFLFGITTISGYGQPRTDALLLKILQQQKDTLFQKVLRHPEYYRLQIIYTRIDRDKQNIPAFNNYYFNVDSLFYFNPASTVKLPLALLSLQKLNRMNIPLVNKYTPMQFDSAFSRQTREYSDSTAKNGYPSIAQFIRKAFLVSDNDAYSRMYEFVGQQQINQDLHRMGYNDARLTHRFVRMSPEENRHTNPVRFIGEDGSLILSQGPAYNTDSFDFSHVNKLGNAYMDWKDSLVHEPFDFTYRNNISLKDLQQILQAALFPQSVAPRKRFDLKEEDYDFLKQYLSQFPSETNYPKYDTNEYFDTYVKFFFQDSTHHHLPKGVRVFNKVGWAYGFMTDISYVADFDHKVEYMLTATLYCNSDGVLNDDKYDLDTVGQPFLYKLGQTIYQEELKRERKYTPDLSAFKIRYEVRDPNDKRPTVKDVDN